MIREVEIKNFRCLRDVRFTLEPLTVLVGPNGSGKSSVLKALQWHLGTDCDPWRMDRTLEVRVTLRGSEGQTFVRSTGPQPQQGLPPVAALRLDPQRSRGANQVQLASTLAEDGSNLVNVFASLPRRTQEELASRFVELIPHFSDVDVQPTSNGAHRLRFRDRWSDVWYSPEQVSDGSMLLLAFLTLQYQEGAPSLVCVEEPERGLHPYLLGQLIEHLRALAKGEVGRPPMQVVLATHSAELLDHVEPTEVRFLTRNEDDGSVNIEEAPLDEPNWKETYSEYEGSVGALWLSGGLGGVPRGG